MTTHRVTVQVTITIDPPLPDVTLADAGPTRYHAEQTAHVSTDMVRPVAAVIGADMLPKMLAREANP